MGRFVQAITVLNSAQMRQEQLQKKVRAEKILVVMRIRLTLRERNYLTASVLISPS